MAGVCCLARRQHHVVSLFSLDEAPSKPTFNKRYSALLGTNISPTNGTFEDDLSFLKVGYVSSLEGILYIYIFIHNHLYALFLFIITSCRQIGLHHGVGLQLKFRQETTTLKLCLRFLRTPTRKIVSSTTTQFQKEFPRIQQRWPFKETDAQCNHCHFASQDKQKTI